MINAAGIELIKRWESFRAAPYICPAGVWTIGYGTTRLPDGSPVTAQTPPIEETTAVLWLRHDLKWAENWVLRLVQMQINEDMLAALASFVYNLGPGSFKASTLLRKLNKGDYFGAAKEFDRWKYAGGQVLAGLVSRRNDEEALFLSFAGVFERAV